MSRANKAFAKILDGRSDANLAFEDLCSVVERLGFTRRQGKGSHMIFYKEGVSEILNLQTRTGRRRHIRSSRCATSFTTTNWRSANAL